MNVFILVIAIFLRMASSLYKTLRPTTLASNFRHNTISIYRLSFHLDHAWDRIHSFNGFDFARRIFLETHAWYFFSTWLFTFSVLRFVRTLLRTWTFFARLAQDELLRHATRSQRLKDPGESALDDLMWDNFDNPECARYKRREQRRLRKHHKKYLVHSMSNIMDIYDIFRNGGLRHFNIGNGWFIRFCIGMSCIRHILGMECYDNSSTSPNIAGWDWTGRPPGTLYEHALSMAVAFIIVVVSFSLTTFSATMKLRSRSEKGAAAAFLRRWIIANLPIERPLFVGFLIGLYRWWICTGSLSTLAYIVLFIGLLDWLHAACNFNMTKAIVSFPGWLLRMYNTWTEPPPRKRFRIHRRSKRGKRFRRFAHCTVFNVDKRTPSTFVTDFGDTPGATIICNNSANIHICNDANLFKSMLPADASKVVATIGGQCNFPKGIGTVTWTWTDDEGTEHTFDVDGVHYFPRSPVNILGVTAFAAQLNDEDATGIDTKWKKSRFYWKGGHSRTINHPENNLPELPLVYNASNNAFFSYLEKCESRNNDTVHFSHSACHSVSNLSPHRRDRDNSF